MSSLRAALRALGPAPRWEEYASFASPIALKGGVIGVKAVVGTGSITVTDGTGATGQLLTLADSAREDVTIKVIESASGITRVRVYYMAALG